jgi:tellurite resistance protein
MQDTTPRVAALLKSRLSPPLVPATFFGMVLGLGGLGNGWRAAARVWNVPDLVGEVLSLSAVAVWLTWLVLYGLKWIASREEAVAGIVKLLGGSREPDALDGEWAGGVMRRA